MYVYVFHNIMSHGFGDQKTTLDEYGSHLGSVYTDVFSNVFIYVGNYFCIFL
jgi:hypothetical protein